LKTAFELLNVLKYQGGYQGRSSGTLTELRRFPLGGRLAAISGKETSTRLSSHLSLEFPMANNACKKRRQRANKASRKYQENSKPSGAHLHTHKLASVLTAAQALHASGRYTESGSKHAAALRDGLRSRDPDPNFLAHLGQVAMRALEKSAAVFNHRRGDGPLTPRQLAAEDDTHSESFIGVSSRGQSTAKDRVEETVKAVEECGQAGLQELGSEVKAVMREFYSGGGPPPAGRDVLAAMCAAMASCPIVQQLSGINNKSDSDSYKLGHGARLLIFVLCMVLRVGVERAVDPDARYQDELPFQKTVGPKYAGIESALAARGWSLMQLGHAMQAGAMEFSCIVCRLGGVQESCADPGFDQGSPGVWSCAMRMFPLLRHRRPTAMGGDVGACQCTQALFLRVCRLNQVDFACPPPDMRRTPRRGDRNFAVQTSSCLRDVVELMMAE
jgi:hypothetical protein